MTGRPARPPFPVAAIIAPLLLFATSVPAVQLIPVAVSIPPQKYFVDRIGGPRVDVKTALEAGHVPETYEPSSRKIAALGAVRLYFRIGVPFEERWIARSGNDMQDTKVIDCCRQFARASGHSLIHSHDPHVWLDPLLALKFAELVTQSLADIDPDKAASYYDNFKVLSADIMKLDQTIRDRLRDRRTSFFIIAHGSLGHLADRYGLTQVAVEEGSRSPGPRSLAAIVDLARREYLNTLFVEQQFKSATVRTLARELHARVLTIDPLREDYIDNMLAIAAALAEATK